MSLIAAMGRGAGRLGRSIAMRSRWLAKRLWLVAVAESGWAAWRHWHRLESPERQRLLSLARKSRGRPSNLTASERREADRLLEKLGHVELAGSVAASWLPFRWMSRLVTRVIAPRAKLSRETRS